MALTKTSNQVTQIPYKRNILINGDMNTWQRGKTFAAASEGIKTADRWEVGKSNDGVVTVQRVADGPSVVAGLGNYFPYCLEVDVTTADASLGATQYASLLYRIEGYDLAQAIGFPLTLSFWVKSYQTGVFCVSFRKGLQSTNVRNYVAEYTINESATWEYKTVTLPTFLPSEIGGTWNFTYGQAMNIWFSLGQGSTYTNAANTWHSAIALGTSNQVNLMSSTSNYFRITGVQFEVGSTATPFEFRNRGLEYALCQRYYEKNLWYDTDPGTATFRNSVTWFAPYTSTAFAYIPFKVDKRYTIAAQSIYSPNTGAAGYVWDNSAGGNVAIGDTAAYWGSSASWASWACTDGRMYSFNWAVDAELIWSD